MSERTEYANGEFCWVELISPDVEAAASFYGDLLGWERVASVRCARVETPAQVEGSSEGRPPRAGATTQIRPTQ